jgi:hypothetical protein
MSMLDGLFLYEIVLLALGVLLFVVLVSALLVAVVRDKQYLRLLPFFLISIVMIGFPSVSSIQVTKDAITIVKATHELEQDPTNAEARASLQDAVQDLALRPIADPEVATSIARAQIALGDDPAAEARIERVLRRAPEHPEALKLKQRIDIERSVAVLTSQVQENPGDQEATSELRQQLTRADELKIADPETLAVFAQAQRVVGEESKAVANEQQAMLIDPGITSRIMATRRMTLQTPTASPEAD